MSGEKDEPLGKLSEEQRQKLRKRLDEETEEYFKSCKRTEYKEGMNRITHLISENGIVSNTVEKLASSQNY